MECVKYYNNTEPSILFFFVGLIIGIVKLILFWIWVFNRKYKSQRSNKVHVINHSIQRGGFLNYLIYENDYVPNYKSYLFETVNGYKIGINEEFKGFLDFLNQRKYFESDEELILKEMDLNFHELFHYLNRRWHGHRYINRMLLNNLLYNNVITKQQYEYHIKNFTNKLKEQIQQFNIQINNRIQELHNQHPTESNEYLRVVIYENIPFYAEELMTTLLSEMKNNVMSVIQSAQSQMKINLQQTQAIHQQYNDVVTHLELALNSTENKIKTVIDNRLAETDKQTKINILEEDIINATRIKKKDALFEAIDRYAGHYDVKDILKHYSEQENNIIEMRRKEFKQQQLNLQRRLNQARQVEINKFIASQQPISDDLENRVERTMKFIDQSVIDRLCETDMQLSEKEHQINKDLDTRDLNEYIQLKDQFSSVVESELSQLVNQTLYYLQGNVQIDQPTINKIIMQYQTESTNIQNNLNVERNQQTTRLNEILAEKQRVRQDYERDIHAQLQDYQANQNKAHEVAMTQRISLDPQIKEKILVQSAANDAVLKQQLLQSKLRQQHILELKLAKVGQNKSDNEPTDADPLERYADIVKNDLDEERKRLLAEYRDQFIQETKAILDQHDLTIAAIIAKYQVEYRKLEFRSNNLKFALEQIKSRLEQEAQNRDPVLANEIIARYNNEMPYLEKKRDDDIAQQQARLEQILAKKKQDACIKMELEREKSLVALEEEGMTDQEILLLERDAILQMEWDKQKIDEESKSETDGFIKDNNRRKELFELEKNQERIYQLAQILNLDIDQFSQLIDEQNIPIDRETKLQLLNQLKSRPLDKSRRVKSALPNQNLSQLTPLDENQFDNDDADVKRKHKRKHKSKRKHRDEESTIDQQPKNEDNEDEF